MEAKTRFLEKVNFTGRKWTSRRRGQPEAPRRLPGAAGPQPEQCGGRHQRVGELHPASGAVPQGGR